MEILGGYDVMLAITGTVGRMEFLVPAGIKRGNATAISLIALRTEKNHEFILGITGECFRVFLVKLASSSISEPSDP